MLPTNLSTIKKLQRQINPIFSGSISSFDVNAASEKDHPKRSRKVSNASKK
jgi:hypothetical protein